MNFRAKILLSPVIAVILMLLLGVVAFLGIRSVQSNLDQLANVNMQRLIQANDARDELLVVNTDVFKLFTWMANFDEARIQNETAVINTRIDGAVKKFEDMSKGIAEEEEKKNLQAVEAGLRKYQKAIGAAIDMATGDVTSGAGMAQAATKIFDGISKQVDQIVDAQKKEAATTLEQTRSDSSRTIVLSLILVALATGGSLFIAWWVTRDVMQQLGGEPDVAADIASRIAAGDLSRTFDIKSGDSSSLMAAMKTMNDTLKGVLADTDTLVKAAAVGDLTTRVDASKHQGDFRKLVQGVNDTVKNIAEPMQITSNYIDQIAKGIIPAQITTAYQGEYLVIRNNLNGLIKMMGDLQSETNILIQGAAVGELNKRANADLFQGGWKQLMEGVNDTVKNIAEPLKLTSSYIDQIAKGIIPAQITNADQGEYLVIRNNLNGLIKMMGDLLSETDILIQGAAVGELNKRANADLFQGGWKQLMEGVNDTVKNIAEPLKLTSSYIDQIAKGIIPAQITNADQGEYLVIRNNLNGLIKMMGDLLEETGTLIQGAADGDLNKRANAAQFQGGWNELVAGVNQIIDGIVLPVNEAVAVLSEMEKGDLTQTVNGNYKGQLNDFKNTVNNTIAKLSQVINEVNGAASSIASASEQVSSTAQSMSQATSEQAASVEETSASVEQMSASINQNTDNAKVTDSMASQAAKQAVEGGSAVKETVAAMKSIAGKIGIIDDIAYQTNLLALNAAIEAARAGEHGKGFAVVAAEVRKLAERSQVAAQEISELASGSVEKAESAGKLLDDIVPAIGKTSELVREIAAASSEQSSGAGQINTAMTQLNQITQQNASSSEELAATAEEMSGQAAQLQQVMGFFKVKS